VDIRGRGFRPGEDEMTKQPWDANRVLMLVGFLMILAAGILMMVTD
jgi:hypothetical protein